MKNNHNDHGRRLEFLEKVYREDRERWRKHEEKHEAESKQDDERWKGHYRQGKLGTGTSFQPEQTGSCLRRFQYGPEGKVLVHSLSLL